MYIYPMYTYYVPAITYTPNTHTINIPPVIYAAFLVGETFIGGEF